MPLVLPLELQRLDAGRVVGKHRVRRAGDGRSGKEEGN